MPGPEGPPQQRRRADEEEQEEGLGDETRSGGSGDGQRHCPVHCDVCDHDGDAQPDARPKPQQEQNDDEWVNDRERDPERSDQNRHVPVDARPLGEQLDQMDYRSDAESRHPDPEDKRDDVVRRGASVRHRSRLETSGRPGRPSCPYQTTLSALG